VSASSYRTTEFTCRIWRTKELCEGGEWMQGHRVVDQHRSMISGLLWSAGHYLARRDVDGASGLTRLHLDVSLGCEREHRQRFFRPEPAFSQSVGGGRWPKERLTQTVSFKSEDDVPVGSGFMKGGFDSVEGFRTRGDLEKAEGERITGKT
jgi:hypothetical protein